MKMKLKNKLLVLSATFLGMIGLTTQAKALSEADRAFVENMKNRIELYAQVQEDRKISDCDSGSTNPFFQTQCFSPDEFNRLCLIYFNEKKGQPLLKKVKAPRGGAFHIGDIHGQLTAFIRQLNAAKRNHALAIHTGDTGDCGANGTEVTAYGYIRQLLDDNVICIQGDHEYSFSKTYRYMFKKYGFNNKFCRPAMMVAESAKPVAVSLEGSNGKKALFIHGGFDQEVEDNFKILEDTKTPITELEGPLPARTLQHYQIAKADKKLNRMLENITWSDFSKENGCYSDFNGRGVGCKFGRGAVDSFGRKNDFQLIFRGHDHDGTEGEGYYEDQSLEQEIPIVTAMGAPQTRNRHNKGVFVKIDQNLNYRIESFADFHSAEVERKYPLGIELRLKKADFDKFVKGFAPFECPFNYFYIKSNNYKENCFISQDLMFIKENPLSDPNELIRAIKEYNAYQIKLRNQFLDDAEKPIYDFSGAKITFLNPPNSVTHLHTLDLKMNRVLTIPAVASADKKYSVEFSDDRRRVPPRLMLFKNVFADIAESKISQPILTRFSKTISAQLKLDPNGIDSTFYQEILTKLNRGLFDVNFTGRKKNDCQVVEISSKVAEPPVMKPTVSALYRYRVSFSDHQAPRMVSIRITKNHGITADEIKTDILTRLGLDSDLFEIDDVIDPKNESVSGMKPFEITVSPVGVDPDLYRQLLGHLC